MRGGADDTELERIIRDAVWQKELKHHVGEPGFIQPLRTMVRDRRLSPEHGRVLPLTGAQQTAPASCRAGCCC